MSLNVDVKLQEDELSDDVFGVWFTFVCCAVNKQSWSKKSRTHLVQRVQDFVFASFFLFYWKDILQQKKKSSNTATWI